jgi:hypothetical protein
VLPGGVGSPRTVRGGVRYTYGDANCRAGHPRRRHRAGSGRRHRRPAARPVDGVLDYSFGNYKLNVLRSPSIVDRGRSARRRGRSAPASWRSRRTTSRTSTRATRRRSSTGWRPASSPASPSPDLLALEEVQDNTGATNNGVVAADQTYALLIAAIVRAGGPTYQFRQIDPTDGADGGEPGGNIRVGFLFRTDRGLSFVDRPGGDATTAVGVTRHRLPAGGADRVTRPDRPDATRRSANSRKPLAGEFPLPGQDAVRGGEPLQLQGWRPAAVRPLPAADAQQRGAAARAGHGA